MTITTWVLIGLRGSEVSVEAFATKEEAIAVLDRRYETVRDMLGNNCEPCRNTAHTDAKVAYDGLIIGHWQVKSLTVK